MRNIKTITSIMTLSCLVMAATSVAAPGKNDGMNKQMTDNQAMRKDKVTIAKGELTDLILKSKDVYKEFTEGEKPRISKEELAEAKCVAIFPKVTKAALVVGGQHGDGVVTCTAGDSNKWSQVGFVDLRGASLGAQLGVKSSSVVMLLSGEEAIQSLKEGKLRFNPELGYTFGNGPREKQVDKPEQVIVYSDSEGAFAEASLEGSYVAADEDELNEFYTKEMNTLATTLSVEPGKDVVAEVNELLILLPTQTS